MLGRWLLCQVLLCRTSEFLRLTRCLICGKGETAGGHDWKTGISKQTKVPHKFKNDNRNDSENPFGFKDKFVANQHRNDRK